MHKILNNLLRYNDKSFLDFENRCFPFGDGKLRDRTIYPGSTRLMQEILEFPFYRSLFNISNWELGTEMAQMKTSPFPWSVNTP